LGKIVNVNKGTSGTSKNTGEDDFISPSVSVAWNFDFNSKQLKNVFIKIFKI
jgi:hypothetical protein